MAKDNTCWSCQGTGRRECYSCGSKGKFKCDSCSGSGLWYCPACGGYGNQYEGGGLCRHCHGSGGGPCRSCGGDGWKTCRRCDGIGYIRCQKCNGTGIYPPFIQTSKETLKSSKRKEEECFFATAIYQDIHAPEVQLLRRFRDEILVKNFSGRIFIALYYAWLGKTLAKIVGYFGEPGRLIFKILMGPLVRGLIRVFRNNFKINQV